MRTQTFAATVTAVLLMVPIPALAGQHGPNDPGFPQQWALASIGAPDAWARGTGEGVTVAVVDSGVDLRHEDLAAKVDADVSCVGSGGDPAECDGSGQDDHGHGSHVAGIAAASTGNGRGVAGVAPGARIMSVKVLEKDPTGKAAGSAADVHAGIVWAVDHGADVVNLSLGENVLIRGLLGSSLEDAVEYAWERGAIPVVAAGNDMLFDSGYRDLPALVVTATNRSDAQASYASNTGDAQWGMAAPGGEGIEADTAIVSTWVGNDYRTTSGTSMAAPHVSGGAAILRSLGLSQNDTVKRLLETASDIGPAGDDQRTGAGLLDLDAATGGLGGTRSPASTTTTTPASTTTAVVGPSGDGGPATPERPVVAGADEKRTPPLRAEPADEPEQNTGTTPAGAHDADETASRSPLPSEGGPDAAVWLALALTAVLAAPLGWRWLRNRPGHAPLDDVTPW